MLGNPTPGNVFHLLAAQDSGRLGPENQVVQRLTVGKFAGVLF